LTWIQAVNWNEMTSERKRLSLFCRDLFQLAENDVCKQRRTFGPHRSVGLTMDRKFGVN